MLWKLCAPNSVFSAEVFPLVVYTYIKRIVGETIKASRVSICRKYIDQQIYVNTVSGNSVVFPNLLFIYIKKIVKKFKQDKRKKKQSINR